MTKERVNITYSIDLEELPAEVGRLVERASKIANKELSESFSELKKIPPENALTLNTLSDIDIARKKLASIDYALNDVADIINGFLHFQVQNNLQQKFENHPQNKQPTPKPEDYMMQVNEELSGES